MTLSARSRPFDMAGVLGRARYRFASRLRAWAAARFGHLIRARALPAAVCAEVALERGERVLSVGRNRSGSCVLVATDRALYHRVGDGGWSRLGWEQIARVGWDAAAGQLVVTGLAGAAPPRTVVPLHRRGTIPELVADRVTHTRLGRWHLRVDLASGTHHVLAEARRRPGTGELVWVVVASANGSGTGPGPRDIGAHIERAIARLGAEFGVTQLPGTGLSLSRQSPETPT